MKKRQTTLSFFTRFRSGKVRPHFSGTFPSAKVKPGHKRHGQKAFIYILGALNKGYSKEVIEKTLLSKGWTQESLTLLFSKIRSKEVSKE